MLDDAFNELVVAAVKVGQPNPALELLSHMDRLGVPLQRAAVGAVQHRQ